MTAIVGHPAGEHSSPLRVLWNDYGRVREATIPVGRDAHIAPRYESGTVKTVPYSTVGRGLCSRRPQAPTVLVLSGFRPLVSPFPA